MDRVLQSGMPSERLMLLGFSQGACLTTEFAAHNPRRYGGMVALTGGLIGGVSTNARMLESAGMIERLTFPGDRRDYYRVSEAVHERMLELRLERMLRTRGVLEEGLETEAAGNPRIRLRLQTHGEFFDRMIEAIADARDAMAAKRSED